MHVFQNVLDRPHDHPEKTLQGCRTTLHDKIRKQNSTCLPKHEPNEENTLKWMAEV